MAINETWKLAPWSNALYACDFLWWQLRAPGTAQFPGLRISGEAEFPGCLWANVKADEYRLLLHGEQIGAGGNGAFQMLNLGVRLDAARILLTGVDCQGGHHHAPHDEDAGLPNPRPETFRKWIAGFETAAKQLTGLPVEVINCSRETALTCFPRASLRNVL